MPTKINKHTRNILLINCTTQTRTNTNPIFHTRMAVEANSDPSTRRKMRRVAVTKSIWSSSKWSISVFQRSMEASQISHHPKSIEFLFFGCVLQDLKFTLCKMSGITVKPFQFLDYWYFSLKVTCIIAKCRTCSTCKLYRASYTYLILMTGQITLLLWPCLHD